MKNIIIVLFLLFPLTAISKPSQRLKLPRPSLSATVTPTPSPTPSPSDDLKGLVY